MCCNFFEHCNYQMYRTSIKYDYGKYQVLFQQAIFLFPHRCHGHGRMLNPPSRASMWRFGYGNPANYNDNELFCGGFEVIQFICRY